MLNPRCQCKNKRKVVSVRVRDLREGAWECFCVYFEVYVRQGVSLKCTSGAGEVTQSVKCLPWKHNDLHLSHSFQGKSQAWGHSCSHSAGGQRQEDPCGSPVRQSSLSCEPQVPERDSNSENTQYTPHGS